MDDGPGGLRLALAGLLISVRDVQGRIQGFQVRQPRGGYLWLSSKAQGGPSSGAPVHVARPVTVSDPRIYITEGPLKANIAAARLGAVVVAMAGIGTWRSVVPVLDELAADVAVVALDVEDPETKAPLIAQLTDIGESLAGELVGRGYAVRFARWDHAAGKGIDDLLLAGGWPALEPYHPPADAEVRPDDTEAQRRLRYLRTIIQAPNMDRTQKILYLNALVKGNLWPWTTPPSGGGQRLPIATIMSGAAIKSYATARPNLEALRDDGLLSYTVGLDAKNTDGRDVAYFRPARPMAFDETPRKPEHLAPAKERAEKARTLRCPACSGDRLRPLHLVCEECAAEFSAAEAERAAAKHARRQYETAQQAGAATQGEESQEALRAEAQTPVPGSDDLSNFDRSEPCSSVPGPLSKFDRSEPAFEEDDDASAIVAALVAELHSKPHVTGLRLAWGWMTGPGGRRYASLPPEDRALVEATYLACEAALHRLQARGEDAASTWVASA